MLPKITIITPSYNQGQYLEQTIDSVLSQNYPNLEYIVIDGGSKDNSVEIIRKYEKYLAFWVSEKDKGQSDAINKGLQKAKGEVINWLNSDDYYENNTLQIVGEIFQNSQINVLCGRSRVFYDESNKTAHFSSGTDIYKNNLAKTIGWARIDQPETFFRATAIRQMGLLNPKFHYVMDKEWWIRYLFLFGLSGIKQINDVLVNFRLHNASKTVSQQENFQIESENLFAEIAHLHHIQLKSSFKLHHTNGKLDAEFYEKVEKELVEKVINYYLLYQTDTSYFHNFIAKARTYLNAIDEKKLSTEDTTLYKKLKVRLHLPAFLLKLIKSLKNFPH